MQTEKSHPEGERIMLETRFTELSALSVDLRVGISRMFSRISACLIIFLTYGIITYDLSFIISYIFDILRRVTTFSEFHSVLFLVTN